VIAKVNYVYILSDVKGILYMDVVDNFYFNPKVFCRVTKILKYSFMLKDAGDAVSSSMSRRLSARNKRSGLVWRF